ncbi:biotin--[acetyl-CoA-carboxylase] ligase [bacterium]|nr:biotin--[acetyl-CoA-carboxylase] ligase [bacterium]|tara:strand:+ start:1318 stop:2088 length:771 start_codon:yes stop_codon:yes gene_type:complete
MSKINKLISGDQVLSEFYEHLIELEVVDSTNNFAKNLYEKKNGICIYSANQKFGYGRNNRKWISHKNKSIALSIILKYKSNEESSVIPLISAVAIRKTLYEFDIDSKIKWPNDILVNSKKISGILCELDYHADSENFIIVGIGINVNFESDDFKDNPEIKYNIEPTSMNLILNKTINIDDVLVKILKNFATSFKSNRSDLISYYKKNWFDKDKNIQVQLGNNLIKGTAIDIKENGSLILRTKSETKEVMSGEIISS